MRYLLLVCSVAISALLVAAPVPKSKTELIEKEPPDEWKVKELAREVPYKDRDGPVELLLWQVIDRDREYNQKFLDRVLVVKEYTDRTPEGESFALVILERDRPQKEPVWRHASTIGGGETGPDGKLVPKAGLCWEFYKTLPDDDGLKKFLADRSWGWPLQKYQEPGKLVPATVPKLIDGGVRHLAWKKMFSRKPPADLFPELRLPSKAK